MESAGALRAGLARLQTFAERYAAGVQPRVEGEVSLAAPEGGASTASDLAAEIEGGALVARVIWSEDGEDLAGCLLWAGDVSRLLGGDPRPAAELGEEDVAALDASLRLAVEEGGEGAMPFDWTALESVRPEGLRNVLREIGAGDTTERVRLNLRVGDGSQVFLLVPVATDTVATGDADATTADANAVGETAGADASAPAPERPAVAAAVTARGPEPIPPGDLRNLQHLLDIRMPLTIRLGSTRMPLEDLLRLSPGSIVELDHGEDEPLEVLANGRVIAHGEVVVVDERFGLRITEIGSREDRIRASF